MQPASSACGARMAQKRRSRWPRGFDREPRDHARSGCSRLTLPSPQSRSKGQSTLQPYLDRPARRAHARPNADHVGSNVPAQRWPWRQSSCCPPARLPLDGDHAHSRSRIRQFGIDVDDDAQADARSFSTGNHRHAAQHNIVIVARLVAARDAVSHCRCAWPIRI